MAISLTPQLAQLARQWLVAAYPQKEITRIVTGSAENGWTKEKAAALTDKEVGQAVEDAMYERNGMRFGGFDAHLYYHRPSAECFPDALANNDAVLKEWGRVLLGKGAMFEEFPDKLRERFSITYSLSSETGLPLTRDAFTKRHRKFDENPHRLFDNHRRLRIFVRQHSPAGTLERAEVLPLHQQVAYSVFLAERILDSMPAGEPAPKTYASRVRPDEQMEKAKAVKGFRQISDRLPSATRWAAFQAGAAGKEVTEQVLDGPRYQAIPGFPANPFRGLSLADARAIGKACGVNIDDRWFPRQAHNEAVSNIARLFGKDYAGANRFIEAVHEARYGFKPETTAERRLAVHDAGQFSLPLGSIDKAAWAAFVSKYPAALGSLGYAVDFEKEYGRAPVSDKEMKAYGYRKTIGILGISATPSAALRYVEDAAAAGIPTSDVRQALTLYRGQAKHRCDLPDVKIQGKDTSEGYSLRMLPPGDYRALTMGHETSCCQRLGSNGEPCAIASFTDPTSAVYMVEKGSELVAQAWVWMAASKKELVIDSIESKRIDGKSVLVTADLFSELSEEFKKQGYHVSLALTNYGMTRQVREAVGITTDSLYDHTAPPKMARRVSYSDAVNSGVVSMDGPLLERRERLAKGLPGLRGGLPSFAKKEGSVPIWERLVTEYQGDYWVPDQRVKQVMREIFKQSKDPADFICAVDSLHSQTHTLLARPQDLRGEMVRAVLSSPDAWNKPTPMGGVSAEKHAYKERLDLMGRMLGKAVQDRDAELVSAAAAAIGDTESKHVIAGLRSALPSLSGDDLAWLKATWPPQSPKFMWEPSGPTSSFEPNLMEIVHEAKRYMADMGGTAEDRDASRGAIYRAMCASGYRLSSASVASESVASESVAGRDVEGLLRFNAANDDLRPAQLAPSLPAPLWAEVLASGSKDLVRLAISQESKTYHILVDSQDKALLFIETAREAGRDDLVKDMLSLYDKKGYGQLPILEDAGYTPAQVVGLVDRAGLERSNFYTPQPPTEELAVAWHITNGGKPDHLPVMEDMGVSKTDGSALADSRLSADDVVRLLDAGYRSKDDTLRLPPDNSSIDADHLVAAAHRANPNFKVANLEDWRDAVKEAYSPETREYLAYPQADDGYARLALQVLSPLEVQDILQQDLSSNSSKEVRQFKLAQAVKELAPSIAEGMPKPQAPVVKEIPAVEKPAPRDSGPRDSGAMGQAFRHASGRSSPERTR